MQDVRSKKKNRTVSFINSEGDARRSEAAFGKNLLSVGKRTRFFGIFLKNLGDPVIKILLFALALNIIFMIKGKTWHEGAGIALSVVCATLISTISEYKRDSAYRRLSKDVGGEYRIIRGGEVTVGSTEEILVGDVIELSAGERIPADCVIIDGELRVDQSSLTGESEEIEKRASTGALSRVSDMLSAFFSLEEKSGEGAPVFDLTPDMEHAIFNGCHVSAGQCTALVCSVGAKSRLGMISDSLSEEDDASPLKERLSELAKQISRIGYVASVLIALAFLFNKFIADSGFHYPLILSRLHDLPFVISSLISAFTLALTVIVMAVPEGLPMMIAVVLSRNAKKMSRDNVLVRHAPGIEAAGCMNLLFTDKTGTLTCGRPQVSRIITSFGEFKSAKRLTEASKSVYTMLSLCSRYTSDVSESSGVRFHTVNAADRALIEFCGADMWKQTAKRVVYDRFDSVKKCASAIVLCNGKEIMLIKGAPEIIMKSAKYALGEDGDICAINKAVFEESIRRYSAEGERVIVCATSYKGQYCIVCAVAMRDPLRKDAQGAVADLKGAGIHVVMVTGDGKLTAERIASDCRILTPLNDLSLSGRDLDMLSDSELSEALPRLAVVYRALPEHKTRLVKLARELNLTCGMTGDGLNDAPALKSADCGFALGCGTDVSKDAADIIILDNRLSSVVNAVMHGRNIFKSIRKFITLQLIMNFTATAVSMIGPFIGIDTPVTVVQMLWINIVMDTLGGLAFAGEHAERRILSEKPKRRDEPVLDSQTVKKVARLSIFTSLLCVFFLKSKAVHAILGTEEGSVYHLTAFFALLIFAGALNCFNSRSERLNLLAGISKNPTFIAMIALVVGVQTVFIYVGSDIMRTVPLSADHLLLVVAFALPVLVFELIAKIYVRLSKKK